MTEPTTVPVDEVVTKLLAVAKEHTNTNSLFIEGFEFGGRSLAAWGEALAVRVDREMSPQDLRQRIAEVANNLQQATHLYARANSLYTAVSDGGTLRKNDLVAALVETYRRDNAKRPAAGVLDQIADSYLREVLSSKLAARIAKDYFRDIRDSLIETRKCLETYQFLLHLEFKLQE
jgi:hypothetical protein